MSSDTNTIRLFGTATDSIVDGPGLRYSVFVQGCTHRCPGCHNPESQPSEGGNLETIDSLISDIQTNKLIQGVTISGGEPLEQSTSCLELARRLKDLGYEVWLYTGYRFEDAIAGIPDASAADLVRLCDVVVDGTFVESLRSYDLVWKGSSNQRVIDVQKSLTAGDVVLWESTEDYPEVPDSW